VVLVGQSPAESGGRLRPIDTIYVAVVHERDVENTIPQTNRRHVLHVTQNASRNRDASGMSSPSSDGIGSGRACREQENQLPKVRGDFGGKQLRPPETSFRHDFRAKLLRQIPTCLAKPDLLSRRTCAPERGSPATADPPCLSHSSRPSFLAYTRPFLASISRICFSSPSRGHSPALTILRYWRRHALAFGIRRGLPIVDNSFDAAIAVGASGNFREPSFTGCAEPLPVAYANAHTNRQRKTTMARCRKCAITSLRRISNQTSCARCGDTSPPIPPSLLLTACSTRC